MIRRPFQYFWFRPTRTGHVNLDCRLRKSVCSNLYLGVTITRFKIAKLHFNITISVSTTNSTTLATIDRSINLQRKPLPIFNKETTSWYFHVNYIHRKIARITTKWVAASTWVFKRNNFISLCLSARLENESNICSCPFITGKF